VVRNIKRSTQIFAIAPLLLLVIGKILSMLGNPANEYFILAAYITNPIFIFHLIIENKKPDRTYSIALILILIASISELFKNMHWHLLGSMTWLAIFGTMMMTYLFLYSSIKIETKKIHYEQLIIGLCLFAQFSLAIYIVILQGELGSSYVQFLFYPIAVLCSTILLKKKYLNLGERNLILYLLVHSLFLIIKQIFYLSRFTV
jgi:hypothetical protein